MHAKRAYIAAQTWEPQPQEEGDPIGGTKNEENLAIGPGIATYPNKDVYTGKACLARLHMSALCCSLSCDGHRHHGHW